MQKISDSQNFLYDVGLVKKLVQNANIMQDDVVLEVGPGKGIITKELLHNCKELIAVEFDKSLFEQLTKKFEQSQNQKLVYGDFLKYKLPEAEYKVFSNIPFNITADIISKLLIDTNNIPVDMYLIMQYEATLKYAGSPYYSESLKSLMLKPMVDIEIIHEFKATDFKPAPNVSIVLTHFHRKEFCDIKKAPMIDYWDFISFVYSAPGKTFKEKTKKIFSYEQQKRLKKALEIDDEISITCWTYSQWLKMFDVYNKMVSKEKKELVKDSYKRLLLEQAKLDKVHRNRNANNHGKAILNNKQKNGKLKLNNKKTQKKT